MYLNARRIFFILNRFYKAEKPVSARNLALCLLILMVGAAGQSCISNKKILYLQDPSIRERQAVQFDNTRPVYRLQQNDVLNITVKGTQPEIAAQFNTSSSGVVGNFNDPTSQYYNGFSIDEKGDVLMPVVGRVQLKGLTMPEAEKLLQQKINLYLKEATLVVKMASFKVSILGEVKKAGQYYIANNQCNLLEAIALGGDLTPIANRQRIKLFRQTGAGTEAVILDLTDGNLLRSPYYYMQPNDVLFVEPIKGQNPRYNLSPLAITLGIITSIIGTTITTVLLINNNGGR